MSPPGKSRRWVWLHWVIALAPFALVLALSIWGYGRYVWIPFVAAVLCPLGMVLTAYAVKRDHDVRRRS